ncbi:MAG: radical SAM protein [Candidatus Latescibacteria bacterium]|nr:radical SAM protein [Candidatus Latescibacterota bacterium]NIM66499.1 radical SAM protein [Candidatus Latescibacterota bacterium]NIO02979.1 radical SAM protein [Candidatus Latescibacterota bacterium]NIO30114.1 radical SAM protein [Candidatus Latescibacterota bacterium]NIO57733.1 radical SAM protein [Candidatus Latescibacterota bacterium]
MNLGYVKYARVGLSYLLKSTELPAGRTLGITVEPTNICNLRCIYCPQSDEKNHFINGRGFMKYETYKVILDNILSDFTPRFVSLHRDGEPLLNKELDKFIEYTVLRGIHTGVSSNCTMLDPERARRLLDAGLGFIKTDFCADEYLFEKLRVGGNWKATYEGMTTILEEAKESDIRFQMNITDLSTHEVADETARTNMEKLRELFSKFEKSVSISKVHFHNALDESIEIMTKDDYKKNHRTYTLCHHPWVHIVVDFRGNVVPCCRDLRSEYICGNLLKTTMKEIWNNDRFIRLRRALAERKPEEINICAKCDLPYRGSYSGKNAVSKISNILFSRTWKR